MRTPNGGRAFCKVGLIVRKGKVIYSRGTGYGRTGWGGVGWGGVACSLGI